MTHRRSSLSQALRRATSSVTLSLWFLLSAITAALPSIRCCCNAFGEFQDTELYSNTFSDAEGICTIVQVTDLKNSPGLFFTQKELRQATNQALQLRQDNYPDFFATFSCSRIQFNCGISSDTWGNSNIFWCRIFLHNMRFFCDHFDSLPVSSVFSAFVSKASLLLSMVSWFCPAVVAIALAHHRRRAGLTQPPHCHRQSHTHTIIAVVTLFPLGLAMPSKLGEEHSVGYAARGKDVMLPEVPFNRFRAGSQFFTVTRQHAEVVVRDRRLWRKFKLSCYNMNSCYPEEHYFPTLLSMEDLDGCTGYTLTRVNWTGSVGGHPHTYGGAEVSPLLIHQLRQSNSTTYSFMFARKFSPDCLQPLLRLANLIFTD
ncbi:hypothetical protein SASPL_108353 [Salvia splendens]|uniref:Uncharacterized protein n=1 Tax=Salvia splendens TaxID=180675 RepID=A0A8X9A867_SALSN|nr:hypothetical protein SASPL_108353 [Salvia splendens]